MLKINEKKFEEWVNNIDYHELVDKMAMEGCFLRDNLPENQVLQCYKIVKECDNSKSLIIDWPTLNIENKLYSVSKLCRKNMELIPTMIKVTSILSETLVAFE